MGFFKDRQIEMDEHGISIGVSAFTCGECIVDVPIAEFIAKNAVAKECSYCKAKRDAPFACPLVDVARMMCELINEEWCDPVEELPYDGGFVGNVLEASELLDFLGFRPDNDELLIDISSHLQAHEWCRKFYFALNPEERNLSGWQRFCHEVKHLRRYKFWTSKKDNQSEHDPDHLPPAAMLGEIAEVVRGMQLIRSFPAGTQVWRAQEHDPVTAPDVPSRFTSPPLQFACQPNRMSPGGVSMFYGAENFETAVTEVSGKEPKPNRRISGLAFEFIRPMQILDLIDLGANVSYFSENGRSRWHNWRFLRSFAMEVSKPIERDERQHIEYVPTQVFTEYVRYHMSSADGLLIDGIRYRSSLNGGPCYVLFFDQDDCLRSRDGRPQALRGVADSLTTIDREVPRK